MSDAERLAQLVSELGAHPGYATGARRFPARIDGDDAEAIAAALAEEMDAGTELRAALAQKKGHRIACHSGCSDCCELIVMVYRPEALRIARWLLLPAQKEARQAFLGAYEGWRGAVGDAPERLSAHFVAGEGAAYDALHMESWKRRVLCAFNREGSCTIYEVRPVACRYAHALETSDRCSASSDRPAEALAFVPLDEFMRDATRLLRAAHNATDAPRHQQESVCAAVYNLLTKSAGT